MLFVLRRWIEMKHVSIVFPHSSDKLCLWSAPLVSEKANDEKKRSEVELKKTNANMVQKRVPTNFIYF